MMHDGLMLNPARLAFTQHGAEFFGEVTEWGAVVAPHKKVFVADVEVLRPRDSECWEDALKQFVIWCYDRRLTPVRA